MRPRAAATLAPSLSLAIALSVSLTACAPQPRIDTATIPPGALGSNQDSATRAIGLSAYVFADPNPSRVNPVDIARAAAAVEYLDGEVRANPRFQGLPPLLGVQLQAARQELRAALGVAPTAPSQRVVDGLLGAADALLADDQARARRALAPDIFTPGGAATLARLSSLPALPATNVATARLAAAMNAPGNSGCFPCD